MILEVITLLLASTLSTIAGIGGGGILLPIYILLLGFEVAKAIPLTIITILGNCLVRFFYLWNKKIIYTNNRYIVDTLPSLIIVPFDGNVSFIGVYLSLIFPKIINLICVIILLSLVLIKTIFKFKKIYKIEKENDTNTICIDGISLPINQHITNFIQTELGEKRKDRYKSLLYLFISILTVSLFSITRNYLEMCSFYYWLHILVQLVLIFAFSIYNCSYVLKMYNYRKNNNFSFIESDIKWDKKNILKLSFYSSLTGILSTYLGIGGGMIMSPVLLGFNMDPEIIGGTLSLTTFFSSLISSINYIMIGKMPYQWSIIGFIIGMLSCYIGVSLNKIIIKKYKKQSFIILSLLFIIFLSIILLSIKGFQELQYSNYVFTSIC